jgi:chemotaxis protein MotB
MKKALQYPVFLSLILLIFLASCGPGKKFAASEDRASKLQKENANKTSQLNDCNLHVDNLNDEKKLLIKENAEYKDNLKFLSATAEMTIADQALRLQSLRNIIKSQKEGMENLKNSISNALINYQTDELYVYVKDGKVYVSLMEKLLFKSGSDVVGTKGISALKSLAKVLNDTKDINVMIEGHTDNVPIKTKKYEDNWDLSTARATSIVRILVKDFGVDPKSVTASGGGKYHPIKTNDTEVGRSGNRRTEIILSPDLKELYNLSSSN